MANKYSEALLSAVDIIAKSRMTEAGYDRTIIATVIAKTGEHKYLLQYEDAFIEAFSIEEIPSATMVYALIPQNDMRSEKQIIGIVKPDGYVRSHAEGYATAAAGEASHAEGYNTKAEHDYSHASGLGTNTSRTAQTVVGEYNTDDENALFIVGAGSSSTPANAFVAGKDGSNAYIKIGTVQITDVQLQALLNKLEV